MSSARLDPIPYELEESLDIAVVGMAGRFPGARNIDEFWNNLRDGVEGVRLYSEEELKELGVPADNFRDPNFVRAGALIADADRFDAAFFGYSPREARVLDPQQRVFLECAWEAVEHAGYDPGRVPGTVGIWAGTSMSTYLLYNLLHSSEFVQPEEAFQVMLGNDKDFLSTRVSYELNFDGPSVDVQTGCSTSLVALHLACQGLLSFQADTALAGGVSVQVPQRTGYFYQPGGINSPDGHCRAFDAKAAGTIFGSGVGIVVLRRLSDALADHDRIHAVIRGSAVNNDGSVKIGYTAPGLQGQATAIEMAQAVADVEPDSITYVEAHGTGTALGDPVEVSALTKAFRTGTDRKQFCALGAAKSSIGHLDAAAGIASFIKTVLSIEHKQLPPSLHYESPNPQIDFESSPFYVNQELSEWRTTGPRRAGVSSFGIGGTNAHVIVEEAPSAVPSGSSRDLQLLLLSAKTSSALDVATANLTEFLERSSAPLADIAHTLQEGRKRFDFRRAVVVADREDAIEALAAGDPQRLVTGFEEGTSRPVVFMFPGGGAQYVGMARDLHATESVFREHLEACAEILANKHEFDLARALYPEKSSGEYSAESVADMQRTSVGLPALFSVEYALARLWMSWGLEPQAMIGHSLGEYVAACLAGVLSLEAALALVSARGELFEQLPKGGMLSVPISEERARGLMGPRLSIAANNGAEQCVLSGPVGAIEEVVQRLESEEIEYRHIKIEVAAHSQSVDLIRDAFRRVVEGVELAPPKVPYVSNVTGTWMTAADAVDPEYWTRHLRSTVRFGEGLDVLLGEPGRILLEVGPGQVLTSLARMRIGRDGGATVVSSVRHPYDRQTDDAFVLASLGKLWMAGAEIDWSGFYRNEERARVALPGYPFERERFWIEPEEAADGIGSRRRSLDKQSDIGDWFSATSWTSTPPVQVGASQGDEPDGFVVLTRPDGLGAAIVDRLRAAGEPVVEVREGASFEELAHDVYSVRPDSRDDFAALVDRLAEGSTTAARFLHFWSLSPNRPVRSGSELFAEAQQVGFYSLIALGQALAEAGRSEPVEIWVVTDRLHQIETRDVLSPEKATLQGPCRVLPQEYPNVSCRTIDVSLPLPETPEESLLADRLCAEVRVPGRSRVIAYRGAQRWVGGYEPVRLESEDDPTSGLRAKGVYLLTGGLGGIGLQLADHLARSVAARMVLVGRSSFPDREDWPAFLATNDNEDSVARKVRRILAMEEQGAEVVVVQADASEAEGVRAMLEHVDARFGALNGVFHVAGVAGEKALQFISDATPEGSERHFEAKVRGVYELERQLRQRDDDLDFCALWSSNAAVLGGLGSVAYSAANLFMDAFAQWRGRLDATRWLSLNWDGWLLEESGRLSESVQTSIDQYAMTPSESLCALGRVLASEVSGQVVVSTGDLGARARLWIEGEGLSWGDDASSGGATKSPRPSVGTAYEPPSNSLEEILAEIWQDALGIEQLGIHDNFFDLGGNSLIGLKVITRINQQLGLEVQVVTLFEGPTVSALAKLLADGGDTLPGYEESQSRGERRRKRREKNRNVGGANA